VETFDEFVTTRSHRLLHVAYLLTRDHMLAEDLLQTALAKCWGAWSRVGDPESYARQVLVNTYNTWWRRRWSHEMPGDVPGSWRRPEWLWCPQLGHHSRFRLTMKMCV
jgi:DNA-directed RNA polymerase specialized sigma24 family protein